MLISGLYFIAVRCGDTKSTGFQAGPYFPNFPYFLTAALLKLQNPKKALIFW